MLCGVVCFVEVERLRPLTAASADEASSLELAAAELAQVRGGEGLVGCSDRMVMRARHCGTCQECHYSWGEQHVVHTASSTGDNGTGEEE